MCELEFVVVEGEGHSRKSVMRRVIYAISSAAIISMLACATSNAAPIAPIPTAAVPNADNLIQVGYYYHGRYYPYHRHVIIIETIMHRLTTLTYRARLTAAIRR